MNRELTKTRLQSGTEKTVYIRRDVCALVDRILHEFSGPIIVYDLETTGLNKTLDRVVQIAAIKLTRNEEGKYRISDKINLFIRPPFPMPEEASMVNHITDEVLKDAPLEEEAFGQILQFFGNMDDENTVVAGYNITSFDNVLMTNLYKRNGKEGFFPGNVIDVMPMAMEIIDRNALTEGKFKQENVAELLGMREQTMHDAFTDAFVSGKLLFYLYEYYIRQLKAPDGYYDDKAKLTIMGMDDLKLSKIVNYINVDVSGIVNGEVRHAKFHYDLYNKRYVEDEGDLMAYANMLKFSYDADRYAGGKISRYRSGRKRRK